MRELPVGPVVVADRDADRCVVVRSVEHQHLLVVTEQPAAGLDGPGSVRRRRRRPEDDHPVNARDHTASSHAAAAGRAQQPAVLLGQLHSAVPLTWRPRPCERLGTSAATVVGHSFGADVALAMARRTDQVARVVVSRAASPPGTATTSGTTRSRSRWTERR